MGDVCASGGYYVAAGCREIVAQPLGLTGSIGVIMSSFGFTDAINRLGIQRRVYTAGQNKDRLDPFTTETPSDLAKIHTVLEQTHQNFIADVLAGRKDRLKGKHSTLFSGDFWLGQQAMKLGLVDGTAPPWAAMKAVFNTTYFIDYTRSDSWWNDISHNVENQFHLALQASSHPRLELMRPFH